MQILIEIIIIITNVIIKIIIITILEQQLLHASNPTTFAPSMAATNGIIAFSTKKVLTTAHLPATKRLPHQ